MTLESVKARIAKLLALTEERGASPAEAATALALAQRMLAEHRLAETECHLPGAAEDHEDASMDWRWEYAVEQQTTTTTGWRGVLAYAIGKTHGCASQWRRQGPYVCIVYFGRRSDAETCAYLLSMAAGEIDRLARANAQGRGRGYAMQYRAGCAAAIAAALYAEHARQRAQYAGSPYALAVLDRFAAAKAQSGTGVKHSRTAQGNGYSAGQRDGAGVSLSQRGPGIGSGALRLGSGR